MCWDFGVGRWSAECEFHFVTSAFAFYLFCGRILPISSQQGLTILFLCFYSRYTFYLCWIIFLAKTCMLESVVSRMSAILSVGILLFKIISYQIFCNIVPYLIFVILRFKISRNELKVCWIVNIFLFTSCRLFWW